MSYRKGADLERLLVMEYRARGYAAWRVAGSKGAADVIAAKPGELLLIQAKCGGRPFADFGPAARERLRTEAELAGATPLLIHKPDRKPYHAYGSHEWPK